MKSQKHPYQIYKYNQPIKNSQYNLNNTQIGYKSNNIQRSLPTLYNFIEYQLKKH